MTKINPGIGLIGALILFSSPAHAQFFFAPQSANAVFAYCFDQAGQVVPNCDVTISNGYYFIPAQHNHTVPPPPLSIILPASGNTGTTGLPVLIGTTQVGQVEAAIVCADLCTITDYYVGYFDFAELISGHFVLIGATTSHPVNHFGTLSALIGIVSVAAQYRAEFPSNPVIAVNDIGLPIGGQFDINANWVAPHASHSRGTAVDVRGNGGANSVPRVAAVQERFRQLCLDNGASRALHESQGTSNEHFHCQW